jgi:hypothetical protein
MLTENTKRTRRHGSAGYVSGEKRPSAQREQHCSFMHMLMHVIGEAVTTSPDRDTLHHETIQPRQ